VSRNTGAEQFLASRLCQRQWCDVLKALASEFNAHLTPEDLSDMFCRVGIRFAESSPLPAGETVAELEEHINLTWALLDWGNAVLSSEDDQLLIEHRFSPLMAAFGEESAAWAGSFLRGVYQRWLEDAGAGEELVLEEVAALDDWGTVCFRLGV
jgi:hypothetical protein